MQIPTIKLSDASQKAAKRIIKTSKNKTSLGEEMKMANYYAFLHSKKNIITDKTDFAKLLLGK